MIKIPKRSHGPSINAFLTASEGILFQFIYRFDFIPIYLLPPERRSGSLLLTLNIFHILF